MCVAKPVAVELRCHATTLIHIMETQSIILYILHGRAFVMYKKKYCEIGEAGSELHGFASFMFFGHSSLFYYAALYMYLQLYWQIL